MRLGRHGELIPVAGFSRLASRGALLVAKASAWRSHDGLRVISSLNQAHLPGSGDPPLVGPQWHLSVARMTGGREDRPTAAEVRRAVDGFAMPTFDVDNHHPGLAWHLWCPVDERYRLACECKATEVLITEPDGYQWSTERDVCRGCEYDRLMAGRYPCPVHAGQNA